LRPVDHLLVAVEAQALDVHRGEHLGVVLLEQAERVERVEQALLRQRARAASLTCTRLKTMLSPCFFTHSASSGSKA
jgi:hypothetical protein